MDTRLLTYLQADDNEHARGLLCDQPPAPSAELLCALKHLDALRRVNDELLAVFEAADEMLDVWVAEGRSMPEFRRVRVQARAEALKCAVDAARDAAKAKVAA